jgi:hypothetical protein
MMLQAPNGAGRVTDGGAKVCELAGWGRWGGERRGGSEERRLEPVFLLAVSRGRRRRI